MSKTVLAEFLERQGQGSGGLGFSYLLNRKQGRLLNWKKRASQQTCSRSRRITCEKSALRVHIPSWNSPKNIAKLFTGLFASHNPAS